jgi:hypothetical protein
VALGSTSIPPPEPGSSGGLRTRAANTEALAAAAMEHAAPGSPDWAALCQLREARAGARA